MVCRLVLKEMCLPPTPRAKPLIPLAFINKCIHSYFDFGHLSSNKPSEIDKGHLTGKKLKQSASQMTALLRVLPFIIFHKCPEEKLELLLKLIQLVDSCLAFIMNFVDIDELEKGLKILEMLLKLYIQERKH